MRLSLFCRALGLGVGFYAAACTPGGGSGETSSGSDTDACTPGTLNCMCDAGGCDAGLVCASGFCVAHDDMSTTDVMSTSVTTTGVTDSTTGPGPTGSSGDSMTTGEPVQCDDGPGLSKQCPIGTPYCTAEGVCADCTGIVCADIDAAAPACDAGSGLCVECTARDAVACSGAAPVCDPDQNVCVKCDAHEQCASGACDLGSGECFPAEGALWVDRQAACGGAGTEDDPFCEIQDAVVTLAAKTPTVVHVKPGVGAYKTKIDVPGEAVVAIVGEGGAPVIDVDLDALLVNSGARVFLDRLRFGGSAMNMTRGMLCLSGGEVWADRVEFTSREGGAISATDCQLNLRRSRVHFNAGGGLLLDGGATHIENSFITANGTNFSGHGGVLLTDLGELSVVYTTIVGNNAGANAESIHCNDPGPVTLRNVVMFGQAQATSLSCDGAEASDSMVDSMLLMGGANVVVEPVADPGWFKDAPGGDFHVEAGAPFADLGRWRTGDPRVDYDGEARPAVDDSPDWAGADRLP